MKKDEHLVLVDGSSYIFRAYYALPSLKRKKDGLPIGAVSGFCNMLWKLVSEVRNGTKGKDVTHLAIIFDYGSKSFRHKLYPQYKANRLAPPEDLVPQFSLIRLATCAFDLPCIEMENFEADDLIATYTRLAREKEARVTIVSSDKDLMQLIQPGVIMYDPVKNKEITESEVIEKCGVSPGKMIDFQALTGDSVDNIPGVPGIGPKTAAKLLQEFDTLDMLLKSADHIKSVKQREAILRHAEALHLFRELVTLKNDVPVVSGIEDFVLFPPDGKKLISFLKAMELFSLIRRVSASTGTDAAEIEAQAIDIKDAYVKCDVKQGETGCLFESHNQAGLFSAENAHSAPVINTDNAEPEKFWTPKDFVASRMNSLKGKHLKPDRIYDCTENSTYLKNLENDVYATGVMSFKIIADSSNAMRANIIGIMICPSAGNKVFYISLDFLDHKKDKENKTKEEQEVSILIKKLFNDASILKIAHDIKYELLISWRYGLYLKSYDDIMLMSCTLDGGATGDHNIETLSDKWLNRDLSLVSEENLFEKGVSHYGAEYAYTVLQLWMILKPRLVAEGMFSVYERLERPLPEILSKMERAGISIDDKFLSEFSKELTQEISKYEEDIQNLAGENFTIASPKQLGDILFGKMNLPGRKKTKTGQWCTSADTLQELADLGYELPQKILDWRQLAKLKSTYTDALPHFVHPETKRIHTSYALAATTTGRLSSSKPNLQNIPVRTVQGRKIKRAFLAASGFTLVCADYSQIELRVLAHIANVSKLRQAFIEGHDIHRITASEIFNVPLENISSDIRRRAKAINFGIIYGISAFGLAKHLSISREDAKEYIQNYFKRFPGIEEYMETTCSFARQKGYVETIFGRRIHYPEINSKNASIRAFNERAAINARIQGTASDIIRRAMIHIDNKISNFLPSRMLLQVHDELVFEVKEGQEKELITMVRQSMENATMPALSLSVPLEVDIVCRMCWGGA